MLKTVNHVSKFLFLYFPGLLCIMLVSFPGWNPLSLRWPWKSVALKAGKIRFVPFLRHGREVRVPRDDQEKMQVHIEELEKKG